MRNAAKHVEAFADALILQWPAWLLVIGIVVASCGR